MKSKKIWESFLFLLFWGPRAGIDSSQWIAEAARWIEESHQPDLNLIYLPHLDYDLQRYGPNDPRCQAIEEIDELAGSLIEFLSNRGVHCIVLSEYGITEVNRVIYPNRALRHQGWLSIKDEFELDTLDSGGSRAFALTDHQVAHIYIKDKSSEFLAKVKAVSNRSMGWLWFWKERRERKPTWITREREILLPWLKRMHGSHIIFGKKMIKHLNLPAVLIYTGSMGMIRAELFVDPKIPIPKRQSSPQTYRQKTGLPNPHGFNST